MVALLTMIGAFVAHVALHLSGSQKTSLSPNARLVLEYLVPWLGHAEHLASRRSYQQAGTSHDVDVHRMLLAVLLV